MPGYKAHLTGGAALGGGTIAAAVYFSYLPNDVWLLSALFAIAVMASLFPDTDTESKGQNFFYSIMAITDILLIVNHYYQWAAILGLFAMLPALGKHRGWTHTWWAMLIVPAPLIALPWIFFRETWVVTLPFYLAAVVGYFSHLLLDREF